MPREINEHWFGDITLDNYVKVAEQIDALLKKRPYVVVTVNELFGWKPEVRVGQRLHRVRTWKSAEEPVTAAGISIDDDYGVYPIKVNGGAYIAFEPNNFLVEHMTDAGSKLWWRFTLEREQ